MKTAITITLLLITIAMFGQDSTKIISSKAYRIQSAYSIPINGKDTLDDTEFYTSENGLIIFENFINHKGIFSIDAGSERIIFLGIYKEVMSLRDSTSDSNTFEWTYREGGVDSSQYGVITKMYLKGSLEDTGEKEYEFYLRGSNGILDFITTEIITGKKDM